MIYKSFIIEQNINKIDTNIGLFYGENLGLINNFKKLIEKNTSGNSKIIRFNEEEILKNNNYLLREVNNHSLFDEQVIIYIDQVSDKILEIIKEIEKLENYKKIYLFTGLLEKKSKLRNYFEKSNTLFVIPCYEDNEATLKKIILETLKNFKGITPENINMIIENSNSNRVKLDNELDKIKIYFHDKILNTEKLEKLLNIKTNETFDKLKDAALLGNKRDTNKLLGETVFETEKNFFYLNSINQRLSKLMEINNYEGDFEKSINNLRPPIFWKDKPNFITQAKLWNKNKINTIMKTTYDIEIKIKSDSTINKQILIKKLLIDMCQLANA